MNWQLLTRLCSLRSFPLKLICRHKFSKLFRRRRKLKSMSSTTYLQLSHARKKLSLHYKLKMFNKFLWKGLEIREVYSRFRQNGKHFVLMSQTTQLRRETSHDGYRKSAGKYFRLAVVDIHRRRILRSLVSDEGKWKSWSTLQNNNLTGQNTLYLWASLMLFR